VKVVVVVVVTLGSVVTTLVINHTVGGTFNVSVETVVVVPTRAVAVAVTVEVVCTSTPRFGV
jgi:hypothetical protein